LRRPRRFPSNSVFADDSPVMFAAGRERLEMRPAATGSLEIAKTMGIVLVACFAA